MIVDGDGYQLSYETHLTQIVFSFTRGTRCFLQATVRLINSSNSVIKHTAWSGN